MDPITVYVPRPAEFKYVATGTFVSFLIISGCAWVCIFKASHELIKPLRHLNERMLEILDEDNVGDAELKTEESCLEITALNHMFKNLIQDRQFSHNEFLHKEEALAIIDLADNCQSFEKTENHLFAGVCYNNIANLQFKSGKFALAMENYE